MTQMTVKELKAHLLSRFSRAQLLTLARTKLAYPDEKLRKRSTKNLAIRLAAYFASLKQFIVMGETVEIVKLKQEPFTKLQKPIKKDPKVEKGEYFEPGLLKLEGPTHLSKDDLSNLFKIVTLAISCGAIKVSV